MEDDDISTNEFFQELTAKGMKAKSIQILLENDIDSMEAVGAISTSELDSLGLTVGQKAILRKMKQDMGCPGNSDPTSETGAKPKQKTKESRSKGKSPKSSGGSDQSDLGMSRAAPAASSSQAENGASADGDSPSEDCDGPVMWEWKSSKGWHRYGTTASDHIETAYSSQAESVDLSSVQPELTYTVEFKRMRQVHNAEKGKRRPVRRTPIKKPDSDEESD